MNYLSTYKTLKDLHFYTNSEVLLNRKQKMLRGE